MAIPTSGAQWNSAYISTIDSRMGERGDLAGVLIRDNRGSATNISPWADNGSGGFVQNFSPFAQDGTIRTDLLASYRVSGEWITNPNANLGFQLIGAVSESGGIEREPKITNDDAKVLQSNFPFDTSITDEAITVSFTPVETLRPLIQRLRMNLPLSDGSGNPIVEDAGTKNLSLSKLTSGDQVDRQIILLFAKRNAGQFLYTAEGYSLCKLTDIGKYSRSKTDMDTGSLGFKVLPDPYMVDLDASNPGTPALAPAYYARWFGGPGWTVIGGVPVFPGNAPVATASGTTGATVAFTAATGGGDPFSYTVQKSVSPYSTWTAATVASTSGTSTVTTTISGLVTATAYKFQVTATGTNGNSTTSQVSNIATTS